MEGYSYCDILVDASALTSTEVRIRETDSWLKSTVTSSSEIFLIRIYAVFCSLMGNCIGVHCFPFSEISTRSVLSAVISSTFIFSMFPK